MRRVALVGAGLSRFGVREAGFRELIAEAGRACFGSVPALRPADVDGLVVGSVLPERAAFQSHVAPLAAETLGIRPRTLSARTEHMCASGTVGIRYAYAFIAAGLADVVMVVGVEKLNLPDMGEAILNMGAGVDRDWEACFGLTAPPSCTWIRTAPRKHSLPRSPSRTMSIRARTRMPIFDGASRWTRSSVRA